LLLPGVCAAVQCLQAGAFKIGDTAGTLDNIISCKLYRPGSVGFVGQSGGMSNETYNVLSRATDGLYEGELAVRDLAWVVKTLVQQGQLAAALHFTALLPQCLLARQAAKNRACCGSAALAS